MHEWRSLKVAPLFIKVKEMKKYDYLVVGSGLSGSTFAYMARQRGLKCLVIDKRDHLGGNVYCEEKEGINIHKYGAHIFHTNNKEVWNFVNSFVDFNRYTNCPIANYKGELYNLPFNMNTFYQMWGTTTPTNAKIIIEEQRKEAINKLQGKAPSNLEEQALILVGKDIYEKLIKGYTEKQWGRKCSELPSFIIKRLPVRFIFDNNYFNDKYQGIPIGGYNKLIEGLLDGVETRIGVDFFKDREYWENISDKIVFTGKIDEFYNYCYGKLEYRSLIFEEEFHNICNYQGNAVVNYTSENVPYTRIIEHKHFEVFGKNIMDTNYTIITKEYPTQFKDGMEAYYPINDIKNESLYNKYKNLANKEQRVLFIGRLAEYSYYNMDEIVNNVLNFFK